MDVAVVCEGKHDFTALQRFCSVIIGEHARLSCIQPNADATSAHGGFGRVIGWCKRYGGTKLGSFLDIPLFTQSKTYDLILIHIDGDAASHCAQHSTTSKSDFSNMKPGEIAAEISAILLGLLNPSSAQSPKIKFAVPVQHTEAWILAGVHSDNLEYEYIDAKSLFNQIFLTKAGTSTAAKYDEISEMAAKNHVQVAERCESFALFSRQFAH